MSLTAAEAQRVAVLRSYGVFDTPPGSEFDPLTQLLARLCATPYALVSLVDSEHVWVQSAHGFEWRTARRTESLLSLIHI